jgi:membrane-bound lytic murein transglycosylase A
VAEYPEFRDQLAYAQLSQSIAMSLAYLRKRPPEHPIPFGEDTYTAAHLIRSLETFAAMIADNPSPRRLNELLATHFRVYRVAGGEPSKNVLFTGYYEPIMQGRAMPSAQFPIPVHPRPKDLVDIDLSLFAPDLEGRRIVGRNSGHTVLPYPDRAGINQDPNFDRIAPPLAWVRDEVDLFMMMVQGSGKLEMENGEMLSLHFDGSNGRPYRSIGRLLIDQGKIDPDDMSMQAIRDYLHRNPEQIRAVLDYNPRYIFFRRVPQGPIGALGVTLTPLRSLAVDRHLFPMAALAFVALPVPRMDPQGQILQWEPYHGFAMSQDTGSAIKGPARADLFWGTGEHAEIAAGHLRHAGALYFIVLDPTASLSN